MTSVVSAVGRLGADGPWVGFAPSEGGFELIAGRGSVAVGMPASADDLLSLAIAFFEESLVDPPEELAATLGDIGEMVHWLANAESRVDARGRRNEAVDAIDDGLAADVVVSRLTACLERGEEPIARLERRAMELLGRRQA